MTNTRTLIEGGTVVSMDPRIGVLERGDVLVEHGKIVEVAPQIHCTDAHRIDASRMIVAPGFVDTHRHVWQTQLRGVASDWSLFDYSCLMRNAYSASYDAEDAFLGNYVGALEALNAGVTTTDLGSAATVALGSCRPVTRGGVSSFRRTSSVSTPTHGMVAATSSRAVPKGLHLSHAVTSGVAAAPWLR